jgi:RNA polymerase sigma factor (sigma-70 family)
MTVLGQVSLSEPFPVADAAADEFEAVVRDHSRLVYRIAYSVLRSHHDAEDATQETFMRCLRWWKRLDPVRNRRAWLARTAWRVALDRRPRFRAVSLDDAAEAVAATRAAADEIAANQQMEAIVERQLLRCCMHCRFAATRDGRGDRSKKRADNDSEYRPHHQLGEEPN